MNIGRSTSQPSFFLPERAREDADLLEVLEARKHRFDINHRRALDGFDGTSRRPLPKINGITEESIVRYEVSCCCAIPPYSREVLAPAASRSTTVVSIPRTANAVASVSPVGPAPTIRTSVLAVLTALSGQQLLVTNCRRRSMQNAEHLWRAGESARRRCEKRGYSTDSS
jgi:hypothetical protein